MFERYTEKARRAIFFARYEASQYARIESEHLLLGVMREDKVPLLKSKPFARKLNRTSRYESAFPPSVEVPFGQECKRILIHALEETERLGHKHVGTEHLLLGIRREDQCLAARMLQAHEVTVSRVREQDASSGRESEPVSDPAPMSNSDLQPAAEFLFQRRPFVSDRPELTPIEGHRIQDEERSLLEGKHPTASRIPKNWCYRVLMCPPSRSATITAPDVKEDLGLLWWICISTRPLAVVSAGRKIRCDA